MGDAMAYKFHFSNFDDLKRAYSVIFDSEDAITAPLNDHDLWVVNAVRNVLVHRGGIVDKPFLQKVKKRAELAALDEGVEIPLNGEMTKQMTDTAIRCSVELLSQVDQWLERTTIRPRSNDDQGTPLDSCQL